MYMHNSVGCIHASTYRTPHPQLDTQHLHTTNQFPNAGTVRSRYRMRETLLLVSLLYVMALAPTSRPQQARYSPAMQPGDGLNARSTRQHALNWCTAGSTLEPQLRRLSSRRERCSRLFYAPRVCASCGSVREGMRERGRAAIIAGMDVMGRKGRYAAHKLAEIYRQSVLL